MGARYGGRGFLPVTLDMRETILRAICDALNDQLDDGYQVFGDGVDYDTVDVSLDDGAIVIDGLGPEFAAYTVEVKWL